MPYINIEERPFLETPGAPAASAGELNYQITKLIIRYMRVHGRSYNTYAQIEGVLNHVSKELYRRSAAPYEDRKMLENGEVFPGELVR